MLEDSVLEPAELRRQVTSPGGTTEAGIATLEAREFEETIAEAVVAAAKRSVELGEGAPGALDTKN
jgi:pyrroline-5-carboxylate reductase